MIALGTSHAAEMDYWDEVEWQRRLALGENGERERWYGGDAPGVVHLYARHLTGKLWLVEFWELSPWKHNFARNGKLLVRRVGRGVVEQDVLSAPVVP